MSINTPTPRNRTLENRVNEERRSLKMNHTGLFDIPQEVYEEGMDYHYGRIVVNGEIDNRYDQLLDEKWELVPRKKAAENDPLGRNTNYKNYYHKKGHSLFKRSTAIGEEEKKQENRRKNARIRALDALRHEDLSDIIG
jgi:hypothetical protein